MSFLLLSLDPAALVRACPGGIAQGLLWGIMSLGVFLTYKVLNMADLTVDGSFATGGAVSVMLILGGWNPELSLLAALLAGALAGLVTGLLHTKLGIPVILAGILTQISLYSINLKIMGKANQALNITQVSLRFTSSAPLLGRTIAIAGLAALLLIVLLYIYLGTEHGSSVRATGNNEAMSRSLGISTDVVKLIALSLSNGLVALSGAMLAQFQGFADVSMGRGAIVIGLAAVIIGEVIGELLFGKGMSFFLRLLFVLIGAILYYLVYVFVLWLKFPANDMKLLTAVVVAVFLAIPHVQAMRKSSFRQAGAAARHAGAMESFEKGGKAEC